MIIQIQNLTIVIILSRLKTFSYKSYNDDLQQYHLHCIFVCSHGRLARLVGKELPPWPVEKLGLLSIYLYEHYNTFYKNILKFGFKIIGILSTCLMSNSEDFLKKIFVSINIDFCCLQNSIILVMAVTI